MKLNPFLLAPMAGITDVAFRSFMKKLGAGIVVTELVSATGLRFKSSKTLDLLRFTPDQHPIGAQIFGESLEDLAHAAGVVEDLGFDFVDLNFGCPVPKVVKKGAGSALLKDLPQARKVFQAVRGATALPVTVKIRTGWDSTTLNAEELSRMAHEEGLSWVAIHGRTRQQGYSGYADWDYIKKVKVHAKVPIIGNGDIQSASTAVSRLVESGCDAVMIGRGCLKNPNIFQEAMALLTKSPFTRTPIMALIDQLHASLEKHFDDRLVLLQLKKFSLWFSSGYPESSTFRRNLFQCNNLDAIKELVHSYFSRFQHDQQGDTSSEAFLMGGHG